jgi:hypothetical protein
MAVELHVKVYEEGVRFAEKYGKQILIIAAAAAITYFSGGAMAGFGMALLQGAIIGGGIGIVLGTRQVLMNGGSISDILNAGLNGAVNGATAGATAYAAGSAANAVFKGASAGKHVLGGVNGYVSSGGDEKGILKGVVASFVPADMGATELFETSRYWNIGLQVVSQAARGYIMEGEKGMYKQMAFGAVTMGIGHLAARYYAGGGPTKFDRGVFVYKSADPNIRSFSIGGAVLLESSAWGKFPAELGGDYFYTNPGLADHEIRHFTEQNTLGGTYLLIHSVSPIGVSGLETEPFHMNPKGGGYNLDDNEELTL